MKLILLAASLAVLPSCANPSHQSEAAELRHRLAALPAVSRVDLDYAEPVTLDSGKIVLGVTMEPEADRARIATVVATAYEAFAGVHHDEEGDLEITLGQNAVHLRSFEPHAEVAAVSRAAANAADVLQGAHVRAEINTQDVAKAPRVETRFVIELKENDRSSLLGELGRLQRAHADVPHASWRIQHDDEVGWLIGTTEGFPDGKQLRLFDDVSAHLPDGAAIRMYDEEFVTAQLRPGTSADEASRMVGRHLDLLDGARRIFYEVTVDRSMVAQFLGGECSFDAGALGARLGEDHAAGCTTISHPTA